jgi:hypothetical protein
MINGHITPIFLENSHERPFSIIPKDNTYGFLTEKLSPPEIQECDLWKGNICGVRCTSLWSMATQLAFLSKIAMNDHFHSIILKDNTYGFFTKKWSPPKSNNVIYGKETYVG